MEKIKQRRHSANAWRRMLARFEESGLTALAFCEREGINSKSFYRRRAKLECAADQPLVAKPARVTDAALGFIDLGALRPASSRLELRLDLGDGMQLYLVRG